MGGSCARGPDQVCLECSGHIASIIRCSCIIIAHCQQSPYDKITDAWPTFSLRAKRTPPFPQNTASGRWIAAQALAVTWLTVLAERRPSRGANPYRACGGLVLQGECCDGTGIFTPADRCICQTRIYLILLFKEITSELNCCAKLYAPRLHTTHATSDNTRMPYAIPTKFDQCKLNTKLRGFVSFVGVLTLNQ